MVGRPVRWTGATAAVGLALLGVPAAARGATLVVAPCSAALPGTPSVPVQGAGFAPNQLVRLTADGRSFGSAVTDAAGGFQGTFFAPPLSSLRRMVQSFRLTATDEAGTATERKLRVARVGATVPVRARPRRRVRMRVSGFRPGQAVYLHVRRGGRTRGTFRIGRAAAPCGVASHRLRYMPLRRWRTGVYDYEFQQSPRFRADRPRVQLRISILRTIGRR